MELDQKSQAHLIENFFRWLASRSGDGDAELIETHISWVLLAGEFAYKIKKPLDLGFLDFSSLARRRHCCLEEIRLNSRLAPDVYLDVMPITGSIDQPSLCGGGEPVEYSVRMRRFSQANLLSRHPEMLTEMVATDLARTLAAFHSTIDRTGPGRGFGLPQRILPHLRQNFDQLGTLMDDPEIDANLTALERWTMRRFRALRGAMERRSSEGFVRECHGDLHLGNIALERGRLIIFDGIEFNPDLRWVDTMSELAFLLMDMEEKGAARLAWVLLDTYLQITGDYQGLELLRFYMVYRAMVRAKVSALRMAQEDAAPAERQRLASELRLYLGTALKYTRPVPSCLLITHGLSASGKSTLCRALLAELPAVRLRSDVERKRLAGMAASDRSRSPLEGGIYTGAFTQMTYDRLLELGRLVIGAGYRLIIDATFLGRRHRASFRMLAQQLQVPFLILDFQVPENELKQRLRRRRLETEEPSEADVMVLEKQLANRDQLSLEERRFSIPVRVDHTPTGDEILKVLELD